MSEPVIVERLDQALARNRNGSGPVDMSAEDAQVQREVAALLETASLLEVLRPVEMPDVDQRLADRQQFLDSAQARGLPTAAPRSSSRLSQWQAAIAGALAGAWPGRRPKEQRGMAFAIMRIALIVAVIASSFGGVAIVTADALPGTPAYALKLANEQFRGWMIDDPAEEAQLHMTLAQRRVQEMVQLAAMNQAADEQLQERLREHLALAFHFAAQTPDEVLAPWLVQAQEQIAARVQTLQQARLGGGGEQVQATIRSAVQLMTRAGYDAAAGQGDPQAFRNRYQQGPPEGAPFGPGDGACDGCEPQGDQHRYGPQPDDPGGPHGDCINCEPQGDEHRYGQPPGGPGNGEPGNGEGNQYGQPPGNDNPPGNGSGEGNQYGQPPGNDDPPGNGEPGNGNGNQYGQPPGNDNPPGQPGNGEPGSGSGNQYGQPPGNEQPPGNDDPGTGEGGGEGNQHGQPPGNEQPPGNDDPGSGEGGGDGEQNGNGPGGPNDDCSNDDCTPDGDQNQNGPQPGQQPGEGGPGGNEDGDGTPDGDQNQNGNGGSEAGGGNGGGGSDSSGGGGGRP